MIHVIVPAYDCRQALWKCLASLAAQDLPGMNVVLIDDASPDHAQRDLVAWAAEHYGWTAIQNESNLGAVPNIVAGITAADPDPDDVIFLLDGDDSLPHAGVLSRIHEIYQNDPDCWLTYGSYEAVPPTAGCHPAYPYPFEVQWKLRYRTHETLFNHPLTFKAHLFAALDVDTDLHLTDGSWIPEIYDEALMYPMLELAGPNHRFLPEILYLYNAANPLNVSKKADQTREAAAANALRARPPKLCLVDGYPLPDDHPLFKELYPCTCLPSPAEIDRGSDG